MRGMGLFFGRRTRNVPIKLHDPHPIPFYGRGDEHSGDAGKDGFTILSKADPNAQGDPPRVSGALYRVPMGPDESFEE